MLKRIKIKTALLWQHGQSAFTYALLGLVAMMVDFSVLYFLTEFVHFFYLYSLIVAYVIATIVNYTLQKRITFKCARQDYFKQFLQFFLVGSVGMAINVMIVYFGTEHLGLWYIYGKAIATFFAFLWNYSANKYFTFGSSHTS